MTVEIEFTNNHPTFSFTQESFFLEKIIKLLNQEGFPKDLYVHYIFLNDDELLEINKEYLQHDFYTDIITFPIEETDESLEADIFISMDRVQDNAKEYGVEFSNELLRVVLHGMLHLCSYQDKTAEEEKLMREKEQFYMDL
jgi:probable rRNA maturation factor